MKISSIKFQTLVLGTCLHLSILPSNAQIQKGADIDGEADFYVLGSSVSMPDANTIAVGAPGSYDGSCRCAGKVRIYSWSGTNWLQKGTDIDGKSEDDYFGRSISMPDSNIIAIGAPFTDKGGEVRIYNWSGTAWVQKGFQINGEEVYDGLGKSISMPDSNTIAIGVPDNDANGKDAGHVRIYDWSGSAWIQRGANIVGEGAGDRSGFSVSMPDANTVAIGAPRNDGNGDDAGHVRIYNWSGTAWIQKGFQINGGAPGDFFGESISMPDSNTIAMASPFADAKRGEVRIYNWSGTAWVQKGFQISGEEVYAGFGESISMPDSNTIAIGIPGIDGKDAGRVRIYDWSGSAWIQRGANIVGEGAGDLSGSSLCMPDPNTIAIGAPYNYENGTVSGQVRVYSIGE